MFYDMDYDLESQYEDRWGGGEDWWEEYDDSDLDPIVCAECEEEFWSWRVYDGHVCALTEPPEFGPALDAVTDFEPFYPEWDNEPPF